MKITNEMKLGTTLHLRSGHTFELKSTEPVTCGIMLTFKVTPPARKEARYER